MKFLKFSFIFTDYIKNIILQRDIDIQSFYFLSFHLPLSSTPDIYREKTVQSAWLDCLYISFIYLTEHLIHFKNELS